MTTFDPPEKRITLRVPPRLSEAIEAKTRDTGRSVNAEIVSRLQGSLTAEQTIGDAASGDPYATVLAAIDTIRRASQVIDNALLQIGVDNGRVKVGEDPGSYAVELSATQREILGLLVKTDEDTQQALLQLLKKNS